MRTSYFQPVLAFFAFLGLALSWSLGMPLLSAADEPEHVVKAAAVVRGEFSGPPKVIDFAGWQHTYTSPDFVEETYRLPHSLVEALAAHDPQCYQFRVNVAADCTVSANKAEELHAQDSATSHMNYFPLYYAAVGWPSLIFSGDAAIYGMRIASAVITALMLAAAFTTSIRRRGAAALGVLAAATPEAVYFGAVVNPSGLEISSALLAWASLLSLVRAEPGASGMRRDRVMFVVSAAVLIVVRPLGPVWLALIVAAVLGTSTGLRDRMRRMLRAPGVRLTTGLLTLSLIAAGVWDLTQNTMGMIPKTAPGYTLATGAYLTLFQTPGFLAQMLGTIGWIDVRVPTVTTMFWYGAIAALLLLALVLGNRRERVVLLALTALIVLFPIAFEAYAGTGYGVGWQGRYGLPLAVGLPILGAEILVRRLSGTAWGAVPRAFSTIFGATLAIAYLCEVWWAWRRYAQGVVTGHLVPLHAQWSPPIGWPATLALATAGCAALLILVRSSSQVGPVGRSDTGELSGAGATGPIRTDRPNAMGAAQPDPLSAN
jgi:hypothetical protein